jgi:CIC family chloride channel protein
MILEWFRGRLATVNALPQLAFLGVLTGLITAVVILSFRYTIDASLAYFLDGDVENFEGLSIAARIASIMLGAGLLALLLHRYGPSVRRVGVVHVMERLSLHQGYLPFKTAAIQFFGGAIALISGQSGGREGPAIHLGATAASLLGQKAKLPNNSMRTLVACGTAAAIASSFDTPIAGVIFAMEVVMMEYTIASFIPVIVAAVTSTFITQYFYGNEPAFTVTALQMNSYLEIPYLILGGVIIGCIAAAYIQMIQAFARLSNLTFWFRMMIAGAITASVAAFVPQVMGVGYDSVNEIMLAQTTLGLMLLVLVAKAVTSAASVGLGMPVGLIGPTLLMGATVGGIFASLVSSQGADISAGLYVMLGMSAMMGAVLQAPLAALMTVVEMTANTNIILPAMLIIVVATMVVSQVFKQRSVFIATLNTLGLQYPPDPVALHLQRVGATAIMDRSFKRLTETISRSQAEEVLLATPNWIVVDDNEGRLRAVLNPADLAAFLEARSEEQEIGLLQLPGQRMDVTQIDSRATVMQVQQAITDTDTEACCVTKTTAPMISPVIGVITKSHIDNYRNTN